MNEHMISRAKEILESVIYITIATCNEDGQPWVTPVYSAHDDEYNFFWVSSPRSQHSKNIARDPRVGIVVYDTSQAEGTGEGVYIQALVEELSDRAEIEHALLFHCGRKNKPVKPVEDFLGDSSRRAYRARPVKFWINTDEKVNGHHVDGRVEIELR